LVRNHRLATTYTSPDSIVFGNGPDQDDDCVDSDPSLACYPDPYMKHDGSGERHDDGTFETPEEAIASMKSEESKDDPEDELLLAEC
jgi:hypothetical protein